MTIFHHNAGCKPATSVASWLTKYLDTLGTAATGINNS